jgi:hypothetical protein
VREKSRASEILMCKVGHRLRTLGQLIRAKYSISLSSISSLSRSSRLKVEAAMHSHICVHFIPNGMMFESLNVKEVTQDDVAIEDSRYKIEYMYCMYFCQHARRMNR